MDMGLKGVAVSVIMTSGLWMYYSGTWSLWKMSLPKGGCTSKGVIGFHYTGSELI